MYAVKQVSNEFVVVSAIDTNIFCFKSSDFWEAIDWAAAANEEENCEIYNEFG